ncbi:hypothetical protein GPLA_1717 [Paraglaciecola polaris LMG 21857]|uniref:Uncharacterized protein n=1 Tax=Paraglaciecola polaris LMG 21857 TaxID=1129793 RepID=K6ZQR7_9ALTE|nr:hypothetical protein GPLA_1717 [Paraglaciecola polaris LMG 21857]
MYESTEKYQYIDIHRYPAESVKIKSTADEDIYRGNDGK